MQTTMMTNAQALIFDVEGLLWEARLAMAQGKTKDLPTLLKVAAAKLNEAAQQG